MSCLSWNCRGLGNSRAIRSLCDLVKSHRPRIYGKLVHEMKIEELRIKLGFSSKFVVNSIGHSGGLAMIWDSSLSCLISSFSNNHINLIISESTGDWRLTCYYGFPERHRRRSSWTLLRALAICSSLPWVCIGDFNDLLSPSDKKGGVAHPNWLFRGFHGALTDCSLNELFCMVIVLLGSRVGVLLTGFKKSWIGALLLQTGLGCSPPISSLTCSLLRPIIPPFYCSFCLLLAGMFRTGLDSKIYG